MCFKIPANAEKDVAERRLSSEKTIASGRREDLEHAPTPAATPESGFIAMFRRLFASFSEGTASSQPHDDKLKGTSEDKREVEQVR